MTTHERLKAQLARHEGYKEKLYRDTVGKLTIGVGYNIEDKGLPYDIIMKLFDDELALCYMEMDEAWPWAQKLSDARRGVLVNMLYNMGMPTVKRFRNMLRALEDKDYALAAFEMLDSKWARQVGDRAKELSFQMKYDELP